MLTPDIRRVFRDVDWNFYEQLLDAAGICPFTRIAYDGTDLEVMWIGLLHEKRAESAWRLIEVITEELDIPSWRTGIMAWQRQAVARGIEADECYFFHPEKMAVAQKPGFNGRAGYPDLAIDINISRPEVDRQGIYAALRVPEVWCFDDETLTIGQLNDQGSFDPVEVSGYLPFRKDEIARWVLFEDTSDVTAWERRLREWVRAEHPGHACPIAAFRP